MENHDSCQGVRCPAADVFIGYVLVRGHLTTRFVTNVAAAAMVDSVDIAVQTAPAKCAEDKAVGLMLVAHDAKVDVQESEVVDDGCGDGDEEEEEGGDEEEGHSEAGR